MIGSISGYSYYTPYTMYTNNSAVGGGYGSDAAIGTAGSVGVPSQGLDGADKSRATGTIKNPGESTTVQPGKKSSPAECETCKERKYQDGSDEMVSFKSATHISPNAAAAAVRAHEQEHVSNAYKKASEDNGKVLRASVAIHTAVCPECGRTYVSGGTTTTQIKYGNEKNPYQQDRKAMDAISLVGANVDLAG